MPYQSASGKKKTVPRISPRTMCVMMLVFAAMGSFAISVIERSWLGIESYTSTTALLEAMSDTSNTMALASAAVILFAFYNLAFPLAVCVLVDEIRHHDHNAKLVLGIFLCALISEPCYDFVISGKFFNTAAQSPVISLLLCAIVLCVIKRYASGKLKTFLLVVLLSVASIVWLMFLSSELGLYMLMLSIIFWFLWDQTIWMNMFALLATVYAFPAPVSLVFIYFFDGRKKPMTARWRWFVFCAYPLQLLACGLLALLFINA